MKSIIKITFVIFLLFGITSLGFSQTNLQLGKAKELVRNEINFSFNEPKDWEKTSESFATNQSNLVASYINRDYNSAIQLYITPIPEKFKESYETFFNDEKVVDEFINQSYPKPINKISNYKVIYINKVPFLSIIFHIDVSQNIKNSPYYKPLKEQGYTDEQIIQLSTQKTLSLITFQKGNMVNFGCTAVLSRFDELLPFFKKINQTIKIK